MAIGRLGNNPLERRNKTSTVVLENRDVNEIKKEEIVKEFGELAHLSKMLIQNIDFLDNSFINRLHNDEKELEIEELKNSIQEIGLLNIIYLQEKEDRKFRIISGLRRLIACKDLYNDSIDIKGKSRVIILRKDTPEEYLDRISIDENTKRKDLTILEQSYKFNKEAAKKNKKIDEILESYNISRKKFYRIKNAMNYPEELKIFVEEIGVEKAEIINKIIKLKPGADTKNLISQLVVKKRDDLRMILKELLSGKKKKNVIFEKSRNAIKIRINKKISNDLEMELKKLLEKIENY
ncbi:ParB/RepB/Spo0J family partition protein [Haliovirga abyssi]|uniref:ParB-like N-terminal domain-containing protein n=1 Tax=Haliovirga abyssi TaxID=2996794 RepID=A0AAU9DGU3_9FUSO|nr:ParB N-terminal domain-containing protein [Haliovirga abyssi]BDU51503.1 hypothetical protein HLVA_20720 [Haliovirga abyssi]